MRPSYTTDFKEIAIEKALTRGSISLKLIAKKLKVGYSTLQRWIKEHDDQVKYDSLNSQSSHLWTRKQQFQILIDTSLMSKSQRVKYCREHKIVLSKLEKWRLSFIEENRTDDQSSKEELESLRAEISLLKKEILRKDKALADTTALLILQDKFQDLLGGSSK